MTTDEIIKLSDLIAQTLNYYCLFDGGSDTEQAENDAAKLIRKEIELFLTPPPKKEISLEEQACNRQKMAILENMPYTRDQHEKEMQELFPNSDG